MSSFFATKKGRLTFLIACVHAIPFNPSHSPPSLTHPQLTSNPCSTASHSSLLSEGCFSLKRVKRDRQASEEGDCDSQHALHLPILPLTTLPTLPNQPFGKHIFSTARTGATTYCRKHRAKEAVDVKQSSCKGIGLPLERELMNIVWNNRWRPSAFFKWGEFVTYSPTHPAKASRERKHPDPAERISNSAAEGS